VLEHVLCPRFKGAQIILEEGKSTFKVGFGRVVASETKLRNLFVNLVSSGFAGVRRDNATEVAGCTRTTCGGVLASV
jgi:hypothetical protein